MGRAHNHLKTFWRNKSKLKLLLSLVVITFRYEIIKILTILD